MQLRIIGTSHIAKQSIEQVERVILELKPKIVAIELDHKRLAGLLSPNKKGSFSWKDARKIGIKGLLFAWIGAWVEHKLGSQVGVLPGDEMRKAIDAAKKVEAKIALIDQDIDITLRRLSQGLTFREKARFLLDIFQGVILRKGIEFDLSKVPEEELIIKLLKEVKIKYPTVHRVLVEERNNHMAKVLASMLKKHPDDLVVAVVGAGHQREIAKIVKKYLNSSG